MTNTNNLPETLKQRGLFCLWKYEERDGRQTKMPYNPNIPQDRAKSNDRSTFAPMATAQARAAGFDGIGIGIFDDIAGIDIDHCIDDAGKLSPMAQDIVQTMDAYTEISPSGKGLRILFLAPGFHYDKERFYIKESKQGLEIYIAGMTNRYLTVTGNTLRSCDLVDRTKQLQTVLDRYMKRNTADPQQQSLDSWQYVRMQQRTAAELTDRELIDRAKDAANGSAFASLWNGNISGYPSHSEADQALCNLLAFWTNKDAARMDSLFRQSGLMRDKWNRRQSGTTYGAITISKAIAGCAEGYIPPQEATASPQTAGTPAPGQNTPADAKTPQNGAERPKTATELFDSFLDKVQTDIYKPLQTGMQSFDAMLGGGILRQSLVILSAAPGTGKTTLAQQIFETMATTGADVVFLNLEMSREQLLARSLSRIIHRNGHSMNAADVLKGYKWTDAQRGFVMEAADEYRSRIAPHFVYNPQGMGCTYQSIGTVLAKYGDAMKAQGRRAPVVVLDYLHLVSSDKKEDAQEIIKNAVQILKDYAVKYDTFVFALSATNRTSNAAGTISLESSRDSSGIEYTADYLLSLNYKALALNETKPGTDKKYRANDPNDMEQLQQQDPRKMIVQVLKNRMNAAGGKLFLAFDSAHSVFYPMDRQDYHAADFYNGDEIGTI
jgi:replicative DNA helicase